MPCRTAFSTSVNRVVGGQRTLQRRRVDVRRVLEAIGHPHLHQLEVGPHQLQLALDCCGGLVEQRQRRAQVRREAAQHRRRMRRAGIDERLHVRERIEQEMRSDLRLQQMQTSVECLSLELAALERERQVLIAHDGFLLPDDRDQRGPRRDEHGEEREHQPPGQAVALLPERWRIAGSEQNVYQERGDRHEHTDRNDLKRPSLEPARELPRPHFEECESRRCREADDDRAE